MASTERAPLDAALAERAAVVGEPVAASAEPLAGISWRLAPLLVASFVGSLPQVGANLFIQAMADGAGTTLAIAGGLRGLGGAMAMAVGVLAAPLIDRIPRAVSIPAALGLTAATTLTLTLDSFPALILFYLGMGATVAVLFPSIQSAAGETLTGPASRRAASLLVSTQSLAAVLAAPLLGFPAAYFGWHGGFWLAAMTAAVLVPVTLATLPWRRPDTTHRLGYLAAFRAVAQAPGALHLLLGATLRSLLWVGWITYLAAFMTEGYGFDTATVAWIWSLSGLFYFLGSVGAERLIRRWPSSAVLVGGVAACGPLGWLLYALTPAWPVLLLLVAGFCAGSAAGVVGMMTLLLERYPEQRGAVLALNQAGLNLGTFFGAVVGGLAIGAGGYPVLGAAQFLLAALTLAAILPAVRR